MKSKNVKIMQIENLEKSYTLKNQTINVLSDISYEFETGKFYAIIGHSGSGKSTLIRILGFIDNNYKGVYKINNITVDSLSDKQLSEFRMKNIGFIFQDFLLNKSLKAYENVIFPMIINPQIKKKERKKRAIDLLESVNLLSRINHFPDELSGGEQQRVAIARALANNPQIILADEPTGNLDKENETLIFEELKRLSEDGKCVVVVSHSNEVFKYADVVLKLDNGKMEDYK